MKRMRDIVLAILLLTIILPACKDDAKSVDQSAIQTDSMPTMVTRNVTTLISDSGMTRYRISSKLWLVYDEVKNPVWKFPVGLYLEKFDSTFKTEAYVKCDSATYFKDRQLWRLDGDVEIRNTKKEVFLTEQVFWSQLEHSVYSDSFIHIEKADRIIEGYGFKSNENMTNYIIFKPSAILPVEERPGMAI